MNADDPSVAEPFSESLVRAGFTDVDRAILERARHADDPRHRVLALRSLRRRGLATAPIWLDALDDGDAAVRREALATLAYESDVSEDLRVRVRACLDDADALVVDAAAFALGELLDTASVERLCVVARTHDDARCREAAVAALGAIGDDRGRAAVLDALDDKPPVRRRAVVALANFEGPDVDAALERARNDRDWQVRAAADQLAIDEI